jgi:small-conductance mechanosensitive channel
VIVLTTILERAAATLGEALPRIGGALLLLVLGLLAARLADRLVRRALLAIGVDGLAERFGVHDVLAGVGLPRSLAAVLGRLVRITLAVVVVVAALSLLGLAGVGAALNAALLFLPKLFVALVIVLVGVVVSQLIGDWADRLADQMALTFPLGRVVQAALLATFILTALAQLGIPTEILFTLIVIALVAAALAGALALGLGSREVAREVSAGRYLAGTYEVGQTISVDDLRGEIVALERAATVLRTNDGRTVRVPNHVLLESIVTLVERPEEARGAEPPTT